MKTINMNSLAIACGLGLACAGATEPHKSVRAPAETSSSAGSAAASIEVTRHELLPAGSDDTTERVRSKATAKMRQIAGKKRVVGSFSLSQEGSVVTIAATFRNLPRGKHGLQILASGSCPAKGAKRAGDHYNPTGARHGPPESSNRHVGDLGNIEVDKRGKARFEMTTDSLTVIEDGPSSVLDRSVVITAREDTGKTELDGDGGPPIACGVIGAVK